MRYRLARVVVAAAIVFGGIAAISVTTGCATVEGDPVATNRARYMQANLNYIAARDAFSDALQRDLDRHARGEPLRLSPAKREQAARYLTEASNLLNEWQASVETNQPFDDVDSLLSIILSVEALVLESNQ